MKTQAAQNLSTSPALHAIHSPESSLNAIDDFIAQNGKTALVRQGEFIGFTWGHFTNFVRAKISDPTCHLHDVDNFLDDFLDQEEVIYRTKQYLSGAV